jgi:hypothetical protein
VDVFPHKRIFDLKNVYRATRGELLQFFNHTADRYARQGKNKNAILLKSEAENRRSLIETSSAGIGNISRNRKITLEEILCVSVSLIKVSKFT